MFDMVERGFGDIVVSGFGDMVVSVFGAGYPVSLSLVFSYTKCMDPSSVSAAMAVGWGWEDSIALSSVGLAPFEINFSLT